MDFSPVYLVERLFYRFVDFFHHWYIDGSRAIAHRFMFTLEVADRAFAVKITAQHFFEPLYRDYTVIGRILGVVFRTGRILIGLAVYLFITILFIVVYAVWLGVPTLILFYAARSI